jgi:hypothetical protein
LPGKQVLFGKSRILKERSPAREAVAKGEGAVTACGVNIIPIGCNKKRPARRKKDGREKAA